MPEFPCKDCICLPKGISMYKLSELRVTDPCKTCIVKPMCTKVCEEFVKRMNFSDVMHIIQEKIRNIFKALFEKIYWIIYCIFSFIGFLIAAILFSILTILLFCGGLFGIYQICMLWKGLMT